MTNLIGQNLGPYRILEQIGRGGMATVYKAYQPAMDRYVAIKVLPAHFMQDPTFVERFEREARTVARLEHPHILPVHDYGKTPDGVTYIVMRYIEAGTMSDLLKQGRLPLNEIVRLFSQVGDALAYAHEQGVIHRDMKPSNVLVDTRGQPFLTDFGLARMVGGESSLTGSMIIGTPAYMAPEQGQGQPADKRTDIYALGIILYEMVTGKTPFEAETPMAVMIKHMTEPLPLPGQLNPDLPPAVERVILKALAKEPDGRYQNVADMVKALQGAVAETPTLPSIPKPTLISEKSALPVSQKEAEPTPRPTWLIPVVAGGALLIVLGIVLILFLSRPTSPDKEKAQVSIADTPQITPTETEALPTEEAVSATATPEVEEPALAQEDEASPSSPSRNWSHFSNTNVVRALALQNELIWAGTEGGLVAWSRADGNYQKYTTLAGLADHNILALQVTSDGVLWAGTEGGGVLRFDGENFETFDSADGLTSDTVISLFETTDGSLLAGTAYGELAISQFDGGDWGVADLPALPVEFPKPIAFAQDEAGHLALGLADEGGLLYLEGDEWGHFTTAAGLPSNSIRGLAYDPDGNLWVVTDVQGGVGIFNGDAFSASPDLADIAGSVIYAAPDDTLWLGTDYEGLWYHDDQTWRRYNNEDDLLLSSYITSILQDDEGLLWLGTLEHGLVRLVDQSLGVWSIENEPAFNSAQQILESEDGRLWFVQLYGGARIVIYDPDTESWDSLETPDQTQALAFDPAGNLWFGTTGGLWRVTAGGARQRFSTEDGLPGDAITALAGTEDGGLWVGTETGLAYHHPDDTETPWRDFTEYLPSPYVTRLYTDPEDQVWVGLAATDDHPAGVARAMDGLISDVWLAGEETPETLQAFQEDIAGHPFSADMAGVNAFAMDGDGNLWVGTWGGGLWRFNSTSGEWREFDERAGAPSSDILTITPDANGTVWFGTWYDGLWGFQEAEGWWQEVTEDGLPGQAVFASYVAADGALWVATESGLARYMPE
jgi:serine/threonine protein kinase/streptogramin lyase